MIHILNDDFKKIEILKKYNFAQYIQKFRDVGTFTINAQLVDENKYLLDETKEYYVLFDESGEYIFGKVTEVKQSGESDNTKEIIIKGNLSKFLFKIRVNKGRIVFSGKTHELINELIYQNITKEIDSERYVNIEIEYDDKKYMDSITSDLIEKQVTGGYLWDIIFELLEQDNLGLFFEPVVESKFVNNDGNETNIDRWKLKISAGKDRTHGNKLGLKPVIFSQQMSNISVANFEYKNEKERNVAYIAGEGEDENRKWFEIKRNEEIKKGWKRTELWVDARDIQSVQNDVELTEEQYEQLIVNRANEKFAENQKEILYEATIVQANKQYRYKEDYNIGDWCTVRDTELKKQFNAQITEVITSIQGSSKIIDIGLSYGLIRKDPVKLIEQNDMLIKEMQTNIKYLLNKVV